MEETFLLLLLSYALTPTLPKGEGIYTLDLGTLGGLMRTEIV